MKQKRNVNQKAVRIFAVLLSVAGLFLTATLAACSSDEDDINYTAEVLAIDSSQLFGRAKIIYSAKDDDSSGCLVKDAQFIFLLNNKTTYDIAEGDIIMFKVFRKIIPDYIDTGLFVQVEIEIIKIKRK